MEEWKDRLLSGVKKNRDGCWVWQGGGSCGYGRFPINGKSLLCHRVAYELFIGPIPAGYHVHHQCWCKRCCNPNHLVALPSRLHMELSNRHWLRTKDKDCCKNGHPRSPENTYIQPGNQKRTCTICRKLNHQERSRRQSMTGNRLPRSLRLLLQRIAQDDRRFMAKVSIGPDGCWNWLGCAPKGYGIFRVDKRNFFAHRYAYEMAGGSLIRAPHLHHICRNRLCVNPAHLQPVTPGEHSLITDNFPAWNKAKTHCKRGHEFTIDTTRLLRGGARSCKTCEHLLYTQRYIPKETPHPREWTHCKNGHPFDTETTKIVTRSDGRTLRICRVCRHQRDLARRRAAGRRCWPRGTSNHCPQGHEFTDENTYWQKMPSGNKTRVCKECRTASNQRSAQKARASNHSP